MKFLRYLELILLITLTKSATGDISGLFNLIQGFLCIKEDFIETVRGSQTEVSCAYMCSFNQRCQAFSLADGPCQLFVFDMCGKSVRDCSCSRRGQVFVKQQLGLEAGSLCPSGYGDDLCGVKYKVLDGVDFWWPSRQKCESESGLVIMADVTDATEMSHVESIYSKYSTGISMWLGGYQTPGSQETRGGWHWVGCNITVDNSLWNAAEPNNYCPYGENVIGRFQWHPDLSDFLDSVDRFPGLCECVSPFN